MVDLAVLDPVGLAGQQGKFVAAGAEAGGVFSEYTGNAVRCTAEQFVACVVTVRIVDELQFVDIQKNEGKISRQCPVAELCGVV